MADYKVDSKKIDSKLEEIYKTFVNYVIKAPFFNVILCYDLRNNKRSRVNNSRRKAIKFCTDDLIIDIPIYYLRHKIKLLVFTNFKLSN